MIKSEIASGDLYGLKPKDLTISISQSDIDAAVVGNSSHCMIADGFKRIFAKKFGYAPIRVAVDFATLRFTDPKKHLRFVYLTPRIGQRKLLLFDQGVKPGPFSFRLNRQGAQVLPAKVEPSAKATAARSQNARQAAAARKTFAAQRRASVHVEKTERKTIITKIGGKPPPKAVFTGNRRQFGIRAMGNLMSDLRKEAEAAQASEI